MLNEFIQKYLKKEIQEYPNRVLEALPSPKVSVWMVTYNQIKYVHLAIESVLMQQTDFEFEIILGDDDSNDGTRELCKEYADKYPDKIRLFLHSRENAIQIAGDRPNPNFQGVYNWHHCRGEYIATLEGDDFWTDPLKLQKQVNFLDSHPTYAGVCTNYSVCNEEGEITQPLKYEKIEFPDFALQYTLHFHTISRTLVCMYRNYTEVRDDLGALAHAPFLDRIILALMSQRGPIRCLEDNTATFRDGSGYFSPLRVTIGLTQRIAQWEILAQYYDNTPWRNLALAELHAARAKMIRKGSWSAALRFWLKNLIPGLKDTYFSWKWYLKLRILREWRIPMSWFACHTEELNLQAGPSFIYKRNIGELVKAAHRAAKVSKSSTVEIIVPILSRDVASAIKWLPAPFFKFGYRILDIRMGRSERNKRIWRIIFVREGSRTERALFM
jgi:glycosyltransferase involved in cell wall biosynthesis